MSDFTSKDHKGLLEAYNSIYNKKEEVVEELNESVEETLTEDYDVNILLENVKDYLVLCGYVDTEDQACNIMPHMTEEFFGKLIGEMHVIGTCISMKEHLISEGCEVEDYTIEDMLNLFEYYEKENLNEEAITAAATSPLWLPAAAAAIGGLGMYLQSRKKQPAKPVDYGQTGARKKPTYDEVKAEIDAKEAEKARKAAERKAAKDQQKQQEAPPKPTPKPTPAPAPTASPAPAPTPSPQPPKPPKGPGVFAKITDKFNKAMQNIDKYNKIPAKSPTTPNFVKNLPSLGQTGQNIKTGVTGLKNVTLGKTWGGLATRTGAAGGEIAISKSGEQPNKSYVVQGTSALIGGTGNVSKAVGKALGEKPSQGGDSFSSWTKSGDTLKNWGQGLSDADKGQLNKKKNNSGFKVNPDGTFTYN